MAIIDLRRQGEGQWKSQGWGVTELRRASSTGGLRMLVSNLPNLLFSATADSLSIVWRGIRPRIRDGE